MRTNRPSRLFCSTLFVVSFLTIGCSSRRESGSLTNFAQRGPQSLIEVNDKDGHSWKIDTVETSKATTYFVIDSQGRVILTAARFDNAAGRKHAVVFVDASEKQDAMSVLDRRFLSRVKKQSDGYKRWVEKNAVFSYGTVEDTRVFDIPGGKLGSSTIKPEGGTIVGRINEAHCHCYELGATCGAFPSTIIACINAICDVINCTIGVINGERTDCNDEGSKAQTTCELAVGEPQ